MLLNGIRTGTREPTGSGTSARKPGESQKGVSRDAQGRRTKTKRAMHAACDSDLKASLLLADERYRQGQTRKARQRRAVRKSAREALESSHIAEEKS